MKGKEEKEDLFREFLECYDDCSREGLEDTPRRMREMYDDELLCGYDTYPGKFLETQFKEDFDELVVIDNIDFYSLCEHHLLPFYGKAHVGYIPDGKVVGASKIPRMVNGYARRLQQQERLTNQIADTMHKEVEAKGVIVYVEGIHLCMRMRGIKKGNTVMKTSAVRGLFHEEAQLEEKFLNMVDNKL